MSAKDIIATAAILGALGVALGAFGAHGLKKMVTPDQLEVFKTGVLYHFIHVFALLAVGIIGLTKPDCHGLSTTAGAFLVGILIFSGSLYALTATYALGAEGWRWLGAVTPIGGVAFIVGWLSLARAVWKAL